MVQDDDQSQGTGFTPGPDDPDPGSFPGQLPWPFPGPVRYPIREPLPPLPRPPDWWTCLRSTPVSGRYDGLMTVPNAGRAALDLRVDIDERHANSPVLKKVSADEYQVFSFAWPGGNRISWRVYRESWIIDTPDVRWSRCQVVVSGRVRYWKGGHATTDARITIPWSNGLIRAASVELTETGGTSRTFSCRRTSDAFRDVSLEIDVCSSVNQAPLVPTYDTHAHATRPPDLPQRTLTIEETYREAGLAVTLDPVHTTIDDSAAGFARWSPAELHDAMETHFSRYSSSWPSWQLWGLMAGTFDSPSVGGIMFDARSAFGGAGEAPERQGFAVFRSHPWFADLVDGVPADQDQAWAMRHFLYTWVHEAGHAFNFLHSWDKSRPDSASWMNYDWRYDSRNGAGSFWSDFRFRFDDEELIHIRHGDRSAVIMGGDPWASGGHLESPPTAFQVSDDGAPLELLLRSKGYFEFLEPVEVELRLRNLLTDTTIEVDPELNPEFGSTIIYVQRPSGHIVQYAPILCKLAVTDSLILQPTGTSLEGADRHSQSVFLSYGSQGFYFDAPGEYRVRAIYQSVGDLLVTSNTLVVRVGRPMTEDQDRLAQDFFTYPVGMSLYLDGSRSPHLEAGMDVLRQVAERFKDQSVGAKAALTVANSLGRPFYRVQEKGRKRAMVRTHQAAPAEAIAVTAPALAYYRKRKDKAANLPEHELVRKRAGFLVQTGDKAKARSELATLRKDLKARDANQSVLNAIEAYEKSIK